MQNAEWVQTAENNALPGTSMPAYCAFPILFFLIHARTWSFVLAAAAVVGIWYLTSKGYTLYWCLRRLGAYIRGDGYCARPVWFIRRFSQVESHNNIF